MCANPHLAPSYSKHSGLIASVPGGHTSATSSTGGGSGSGLGFYTEILCHDGAAATLCLVLGCKGSTEPERSGSRMGVAG